MKPPNSRRNLDLALERRFGLGQPSVRARTVMANAIVARMLPPGATKGGSAIKLRYGDKGTRFTTDLDAAQAVDLQLFLESLEDALRKGWAGFTGRVIQGKPANPADVPCQYVMQPFRVKLSYLGKPWITVPLEVGHNEIGDADEVDLLLPEDIAALFSDVGLPTPGPLPVMALHHQIAQKIHAVTEPGSQRAHDLVDLQIIFLNERIDYPTTKATCERLFSYRKGHSWPPVIVAGKEWPTLYIAAAKGLDVLPSVESAVQWGNATIARIEECKISCPSYRPNVRGAAAYTEREPRPS
ncbi:nucleotidyl transferase AbiEii/AbiGii toxin family protein [Eggerthellaceae bacterium zg-997]|nr:nucleotidyl transferase AbiEii/AbiGii toxin family protein [Eggerthellaceae bacterium zg-997]